MKKTIYILFIVWLGLLGSTGATHAINYDTGKVADARLGRNNNLRNKLDLESYSLDTRLEWTANEWSEYMANLWTRTHKRKKSDWFYNYNSVENWFEDRWLEFKNIKWITFTENVWIWYVSCKQEDCTDEVISAIKTTRNMYMWEAKYRWAHYRSLVQPHFRYIWIWLYITKKNKYYLTIHYATQIIDKDKKVEKKEEAQKNQIKQINVNDLDRLGK